MLRKARRAERGELAEPSVVQTPRAKLVGGIPNAAIGALYYPVLALGIWIARTPAEVAVLVAASVLAAAVSVLLAYSLLYVTRMACAYCWTSHAINWTLATLLIALFKISYWQ